MVGERHRIDVVVETAPGQRPTYDLRPVGQTAHARRETLAGNDLALARVVRRQEVARRQNGDTRVRGRRRSRHVAAQCSVEEAGTCGVQIVAEVLSSRIVEGPDDEVEERMTRRGGNEPVHHVGRLLFTNNKHVFVVLLADEAWRVPRPGVDRPHGVHVQVHVDAAVAVQDEVSAGVGAEHGRLVAVVQCEIVWVVARDQLTDVVQSPEPVLPARVLVSPRLNPLHVHTRHLIRVPDLTDMKHKYNSRNKQHTRQPLAPGSKQ